MKIGTPREPFVICIGQKEERPCMNLGCSPEIHIRAVNFLAELQSDVFSLQETNEEMVKEFVAALNGKHGDKYDYIWHQV